MDYLFERKPEYDENGQIVSHTTPKIVWVIAVAALFYCFRGKLTGQKGGKGGKATKQKGGGFDNTKVGHWLALVLVATVIAIWHPNYWWLGLIIAWLLINQLTTTAS
jgi:hypothetical protein